MTAITPLRRILIVGGGTAGWIAACHLAKKLAPRGIIVTLVESPNIPTIGVGEGTVPMMRDTLKYFGIREDAFISQCDVTFKQSVKFIDWNNESASGEYYHHLFDYPQWRGQTEDWLAKPALGRNSYADQVSWQGLLADAGFAPKAITQPQFDGVCNYAYHLDAAKFTDMLTVHGKSLGVEHLLADVVAVDYCEEQGIRSVSTAQLGTLSADLYVDCTGFAARLIDEACKVPFIDKGDVLLVDTAIVAQVPYQDSQAPIPCFTKSTAKEAGWIWDIGLSTRRGTGYVYSSRHTSDERAAEVLRQYLGEAAPTEFRKIPMKVGYRERSWHKNCVAIGLSSGFVEPLEATGLLIFDVTSRMLAETMPHCLEAMPLVANRYSAQVFQTWLKVIDFIKLHYVLSSRRDTEFWRDNQASESIPDTLKELLALWRYQVPTPYEFASTMDIFKQENFLYVLYGMAYPTQVPAAAIEDGALVTANVAESLMKQLVPHRQLIEKIKQYGLQQV